MATPSLKEGVAHVEPDQFADLPKLTLPEGTALVYYDTADLIDSTWEALLQRTQLDSSHLLVVGFDIEYEIELHGQSGGVSNTGSSSCDVLQIAVHDTVYVFKVDCGFYIS
jgi:hypothetical protein